MVKILITFLTVGILGLASPQTGSAQEVAKKVRKSDRTKSSDKVAAGGKELNAETKRAREKKSPRDEDYSKFVKEYAESTCSTLNTSLDAWEKQAEEIRNNSTHAPYSASIVDIVEREKGLSKITRAACKMLLSLEFELLSPNEGKPLLPKTIDDLIETARFAYADDVCTSLYETLADWLQARITKAASIDDQGQLDAVRHIIHAEMDFVMLLHQGCEINVIGSPTNTSGFDYNK